MAFTGITATEAQIDQKTGADVDTDFTDTMKTESLLQAESFLNVETLFNWSDWYADSPNVDVKSVVTMVTTSLVAIDAINYNLNSYPTRAQAATMMNVLRDNVIRGLETLRKTANKDFAQGA